MKEFETVSTTDPSLKAEMIARLRWLQPTAYWLMHELVVWNDTHRYPDLPAGNSAVERLKRNDLNKFHVKHISAPFKRSIILHLWALLFDKDSDAQTLRVIANRMLIPNKFTLSKAAKEALEGTLKFFKDENVYEVFQKNRSKFIAHVSSIGYTKENFVEDHLLYRFIPKAIYLAELLHLELEGFPDHRDHQFKTLSANIALFFHHSAPDDLLAQLFSQRSLPGRDFNIAAEKFFDAVRKRERGVK